MNDYVLKDRDDGASFNIWSKGSYYSIIDPLNKITWDDILIITPKVNNSSNSISFEVFKDHILDNLDNSMIYAITNTKSISVENPLNKKIQLNMPNQRRLFIDVEEIINKEQYSRVMTVPRRILLSTMILSDDEKCRIEISPKPSKSYASSMREYDII